MRYMMLIRLDPNTSPEPDEALMEQVGKVIEEMTKAGVLLDTNGLHPIAEATRITQAGSKQTVLDGPFTETKEIVGGYCILQTKSKDEAVEWTSRFLGAHGPEWEIEVELRQIAEQG
ncbi:YciI family protein [Nocardia vulneris]|uniref:Transcriptional regulator n=1 Tax=Nocardia vulneris TaxID=1141657 RepID=A0ABR4ZKG3_9NOCA|nr:YciI family protein [Nocardia vulneris]KIA65814.1 transcriptional regulator [Nocardia vulneris]